jgi:lipopolysaccharide transport protein LptA
MNLIKALRLGIGLLLLAILAVVVRYFLARSQAETQTTVGPEKIVQQKVDKKEDIEYLGTKENEKINWIKADKNYFGEDNLIHLEGNVQVVFFKKIEGKDVSLSGDEVAYDKDMNNFLITGHVKARYKDVLIESVLLHYDNKQEIFWTDNGASFSSPRLEGSAQKMVYSMKEKKIELRENIDLHFKPKLETSLPVVIKGNELRYSRETKSGRMEGGVQLFRGESQATASSMEFELNPDEDFVRTLILKGKVKGYFKAEEKKDISSQSKSSFFARSSKREFEAEEIELKSFPDLSAIQDIEARENCSFKFISASEGFTQIMADTVKYTFDREGNLQKFQAIKNAKMIDQGEKAEEQRLISAETFIIEGNTDLLQVKGKAPFEASISSSASDVLAEEFTFFLDKKDVEGKSGVKVVLKPKEGEENLGIFSKKRPVFIRADKMRYFDEQKRFLFNGNIKAWQEKKVLLAGEVDISEQTRKMACAGKVRCVLPHKAKEKKEEMIEISSERMLYEPEENAVLYQGGSVFKAKEFDFEAQSVSVYLNEDGEDMKRAVARGQVTTHQNSYEGKGEEAVYDPKEETIVLSGNPLFEDKDMGVTKADKLTFLLADGRILIENKGRKRSVTVIKRER